MGEAEEIEGLLLDGGGAGEDGEGAICCSRGHDGVPRQGREIGEQGLEAVDRGAVGGAARGAFGEGGRRALHPGDWAFPQGFGGVLLVVLIKHGARRARIHHSTQ